MRIAAVAALVVAAPAAAQDTAPPPPVRVDASIGVVTDYRFRGVSQSDRDPAVQGGATLTHRSGVYAGAWASTLRGWGALSGSDVELDLTGGYRAPVGAAGTIDVGVTWYLFPGGNRRSDIVEPYARLTGTIGPATLTAGVAWAPPQRSIGDAAGRRGDNLYLSGDAVVGVPATPVSVRAHIGRSAGTPGLGPNGRSLSPTGRYWDWSIGADYVWRALTFGAAWVDTDITRGEAARLGPAFRTNRGRPIAGSAVVASVGLAF